MEIFFGIPIMFISFGVALVIEFLYQSTRYIVYGESPNKRLQIVFVAFVIIATVSVVAVVLFMAACYAFFIVLVLVIDYFNF